MVCIVVLNGKIKLGRYAQKWADPHFKSTNVEFSDLR
jgi:hypothetical protein